VHAAGAIKPTDVEEHEILNGVERMLVKPQAVCRMRSLVRR
jgi:hypothetical protein